MSGHIKEQVMRKWVVLVVGLYVVVLFALLTPVAMSVPEVTYVETLPFVGGFVVLMALCQVALLVVPVRVLSRRPVTRRHLFWPVLLALVACLLLAGAMGLAVAETLDNSDLDKDWINAGIITTACVWLVWAFVFGFYTGGREPTSFMQRLARLLVAGSIAELIVAIPTHLLARHRGYCCAGFGTVWGIALGFALILMAFGPGVLALFGRRWQSLQRPTRDD